MLLLLPKPPISVELPGVDFASEVTGPAYVGPPIDSTVVMPDVDFATPVGRVGVEAGATYVQPTEPPPAALGDTWDNSSTGESFVWAATGFGEAWVPVPFVPQLTAELRTPAGVLLSTLDTQSAVSFQDSLNEVGAGSLTIQLDDPDVALVRPGRYVWFRLDGAVVFSIVIDREPVVVALAENEEAGEVLQVSGQGLASRLADAAVYPAYPKYPNPLESAAPANPQHRIYGFASWEYPASRLASWIAPTSQGAAGTQTFRQQSYEFIVDLEDFPDSSEFLLAPAPIEWPFPEAEWVWGDVDPNARLGPNYFRSSFTLVETTNVRIACTGDNFYTLYLDGTPLLGETENINCWSEWREIDIALPAGEYVIGVVVYNESLEYLDDPPPPGEGFNPGGALFAAKAVDDESNPTGPYLVRSSPSGTICLPYPARPPGFTAGEIVLGQLAEAQARGGLLSDFAVGFSATNDSNGRPWDIIPAYSVRATASALESLDGLVQQGLVDWRIDHPTRRLQMFAAGTMTNANVDASNPDLPATFVSFVATPVEYAVTGDIDTQNLRDAQYVQDRRVINRAVVKWPGGYFTIWDDDSHTDLGYWVEGTMNVDAPTRPEAVLEARFLLADGLRAPWGMSASIDPVDESDRPYQGVFVGDYVLAPNPAGVPTPQRVFSVTCSVNDFGRAEFDVELNRRTDAPSKGAQLLQSLGRVLVGDTEYRNTKLAFSEG